MKLSNVFSVGELGTLSRAFAKPIVEQTVDHKSVQDFLDQGWVFAKKLKKGVRLSKPKDLQVAMPDRVWTLLYKMGFSELSGKGGAKLTCRVDHEEVDNQLDVVAIDSDVALYIECRTARAPSKVPRFAEYVAHIDGMRSSFQRAIKSQVGARKIGAIYWSQNQIITENDEIRAKDKAVHLFDEKELAYYEELVKQVGTAARFQLLADIFGNSRVDSLSLKVRP
jgi:DNA sulfur modification protein DndB